MRTPEQVEVFARGLIGKRIEIPVHYDMWMRGARLGEVTSWVRAMPGRSACVIVRLDGLRKRLRVWALDFDYIKII